jgi:hypothetical protein
MKLKQQRKKVTPRQQQDELAAKIFTRYKPIKIK